LGRTCLWGAPEPVAPAVASRLVVLDDGKVVHDGAGKDAAGVLDLMKAVA